MDAQAGKAVLALAGYKEVGKEIDVFKHDGVAMGNELGPMFAARRGYGSGDEAKVAATVVGADEPEAVAVVDGVFLIVLAGCDEGKCAFGFIGRQHMGFAGDVAG